MSTGITKEPPELVRHLVRHINYQRGLVESAEQDLEHALNLAMHAENQAALADLQNFLQRYQMEGRELARVEAWAVGRHL